MQLSKPPKATRKRLKKEILSDDFKKRKIFWKNIAEIFPYGKIFHLTSLAHGGVAILVQKCVHSTTVGQFLLG
jgi:hypothetical protein